MTYPVALHALSIHHHATSVIENLSLQVQAGEFLVLLGPSGCGKSTLLNAIAGLHPASHGTITIGEQDVTLAEPKDRNIAMVFQSYALYPTMTVFDNLAFALKVSGQKKSTIAQKIENVAETLKLTELLYKKPAQLSGGQRQRVAIGRALVREKPVLLFDEPLSNLDAKLRNELRLEIKRLHRHFTSTIIYVTHDQTEAMTLADRIVIMNNGKIEQIGNPLHIYQQPANRFVAEFIGTPPINLLEGQLVLRNNMAVFVADEFTLSLPHFNHVKDTFNSPQISETHVNVILGVRPEDITLDAECVNGIPGFTVELLEQTGPEVLVWCLGYGKRWAVKAPSGTNLQTGGVIYLKFNGDQCSLFHTNSGQRLSNTTPQILNTHN